MTMRGTAASNGPTEVADGPFERVLVSTLDRLDQLLVQEIAALRNASVGDLREFTNRKNQVLLELTQTMGSGARATPSTALRSRLAGVRAKLDANRTALKLHLDAVQEVAGMLADRMREDDSDGTYTHGIRGSGRAL